MEPAHAQILDRIRAIPEGWVRTYGDVSPGTPRLAGTVLRLYDGVPWWRVVRADGTLAVHKPLEQARRLRAEGVEVVNRRVVDAMPQHLR